MGRGPGRGEEGAPRQCPLLQVANRQTQALCEHGCLEILLLTLPAVAGHLRMPLVPNPPPKEEQETASLTLPLPPPPAAARLLLLLLRGVGGV